MLNFFVDGIEGWDVFLHGQKNFRLDLHLLSTEE